MHDAIDQTRFPAPFRIAAPPWDRAAREAVDRIAAALASLPLPLPAEVTTAPPPGPAEADVAFLADLATALFRLRRLMVPVGETTPREEMRRAYRHLDSAWSVLAKAGLDVRDHHDEPVPEGDWGVRILAFEPTPGVTRARVKDTVRPTVYFRDRPLQVAEVVVAIPEEAADGPA